MDVLNRPSPGSSSDRTTSRQDNCQESVFSDSEGSMVEGLGRLTRNPVVASSPVLTTSCLPRLLISNWSVLPVGICSIMSFTFYLFHHLFSLAWKPPLWECSIKIFVYKFSHFCYGNSPSLVIFREITGKKANPVTRILLAWIVLAASHGLSSSTITSTQHAW